MLQVDIGVDEQHQDDVGVGEGLLIGGGAEQVMPEAVGDRGGEGEDVDENPSIDRMDAEIGERVSTSAVWCTLWNSHNSGTLWLSQ